MITTTSTSLPPGGNGFPITEVRAALFALFATAILAPSLYQTTLEWLWGTLRVSRPYQSSTFETFWTVFWYAAIEVLLTVAFMRHPEWRLANQHESKERRNSSSKTPPKPKGMKRPSRRGWEAIVYVAPLLMLDLLMIKKFADVPLEDMLYSGNYDPELLPQLQNSHKATFLMPSLHNMTWNSPLQTKRALPIAAPSSRRLALELVSSLVIYDALFFLFHLSLHVLPLVRTWHRPHHHHGEIHPQITNQLHVFERLGLVLLANFSLNIIGSHVLTRTLFVPVFVYLLIEIHAGVDLPWGYEKILPKGWGGGARKHARHHREGEGGFEPYFEWCDALWDRAIKWSRSS